MKHFEDEVLRATEALKAGKVILYPTDTIWGLGCDASNADAVSKIYRIKGRSETKAMIILIQQIEQLRDYVVKVPDIAWDIVDFSEKPLTVVYPQGKNIAENLRAEDGSIAIRLVREGFCNALLRKFGKAIVSTSANISGQPFPATFNNIDAQIKQSVDYVVGYRKEEESPSAPSVVMKIEMDGAVKFLRK